MTDEINTDEEMREQTFGENVEVDDEDGVVTAFIPHEVEEAQELYRTDPTFRDVVDCVVDECVDGNGYEKSSLTYVGFFYRYRGEMVEIEKERLGLV
jgi:hypothetical protein